MTLTTEKAKTFSSLLKDKGYSVEEIFSQPELDESLNEPEQIIIYSDELDIGHMLGFSSFETIEDKGWFSIDVNDENEETKQVILDLASDYFGALGHIVDGDNDPDKCIFIMEKGSIGEAFFRLRDLGMSDESDLKLLEDCHKRCVIDGTAREENDEMASKIFEAVEAHKNKSLN